MKTKSTDVIMQNKVFVWVALATGLILSIPLIAMYITPEVNWDETDFIVMGTLLFSMGSIFVLTARRFLNKTHRITIGIVLALVLLYFWAELAVGIFTTLGS